MVVSLGENNSDVRLSACEALGRLGEKAATSEVINRLVISLQDYDKNVRESACEALVRLCEKGATSEVINRLVISLVDGEWSVQKSAREALVRLGEKAATSEVINGLVISLGDSDENIRFNACKALGRLGEKAVTSEVINRLVISLGDSDENVRESVCKVLGRLGEKAATSEVVGRLTIALGYDDSWIRAVAVESVNKLVSMFGRRNGSEVSSVSDNSEHLINENELVENPSICIKLFELLQKSGDSSWIRGFFAAALFGDCYVIMIENRIVVSDDTQPLQVELSNSMRREIFKGFDNLWRQVWNVYRTGGALPGQKRKRSDS